MTVKSSVPSVSRRTGEAAGSRRKHQLAVAAMAAVMAAGYSVYSLLLNYTFHTGSYDLVIFDQAVRSYAHFQPGVSILKGVHNGFGPHFSVLGDHWSPIDAVLAPFYWLFNTPAVLLIAQPVLFALAIPPLWVFTRRAFGDGRRATAAAYLVAAAYALSWPIAEASRATFHEVAFAPVLTAVALERLQAGRLRTALLALGGLCLVKEDMGLLIAGLGAALLVSPTRMVNRQRIVGAGLIAAGVADTWLAVYVLIPAFGGRPGYYWAYTDLGKNVPQVAWHVLTDPFLAARLLLTPGVKLNTMLWLFGALCFLPLLSPLSVAAVPLLLERMLANKFPNWWATAHQYNAFLVVVLVAAAVDGAARLGRWVSATRRHAAARTPGAAAAEAVPATVGPPVNAPPATSPSAGRSPASPLRAGLPPAAQKVALACAGAMAAVAVALVPHFPLGQALAASFYQRDAKANAAAAAVALIPPHVTVEAVNQIGPHLSARDTVLLWDQAGPRWAPWVVANVGRHTFTFKSLGAQKRRVTLLEHNGYRVLLDRKGYIVLHRDSGLAGSGASGKGA